MKDFSQVKKNLKHDFSRLRKVKVALLGDTSTQFLVQALRGVGFDQQLDLQIWEADFNQVENHIFDLNSELYKGEPEIIILFYSSHKLLEKYNKSPANLYSSFASSELKRIETIYNAIVGNTKAKLIYYNYTEIDDAVFGNYANKTENSFLFQLRKLNYELMLFSAGRSDFYLCDLSTLQNNVGKQTFFPTTVYLNTEMVLSIEVLPAIAFRTLDIINALTGRFKKCIVLDLDNVLWGGTIGDNGIENIELGSLGIGKAFTEFQYWIKKLKNRGILLAVCSKNTESIAKEVFEKHPDMVLRLEDIAVFMANWENKADNIRQIQNILNIGFESMVFIDDNPFERNLVRQNIPEICVPEIPEDPADYLEYLYGLNLFETVSITQEDAERTKLYQLETERNSVREKFTNEADFLKSLGMVSVAESFTKFNIPRVAQLSQRSNQFNLRTVRYTDAEIEKLGQSKGCYTFAFTLEDKYGNHGLIAVVILKKETPQVLFIDSWFMSCRVLKRGMENFILNTVVSLALENGYAVLKGEYIPTPKNELVKDHYRNLGFIEKENFWELDLKHYKQKECFINRK